MTGTSSFLYNHEGFNSPTETEREKLFAFILNHHVGAIARALRCAPNALSALLKAFKVIVSCLMCDDRTSLDWAHLFKNGLSAVIKLTCVITPFFILSLSCPECACNFSCSLNE